MIAQARQLHYHAKQFLICGDLFKKQIIVEKPATKTTSPGSLQGSKKGGVFNLISKQYLKILLERHPLSFPLSCRGRISSVGRAFDCRAEGRGFDFRGLTSTQGLKISEK